MSSHDVGELVRQAIAAPEQHQPQLLAHLLTTLETQPHAAPPIWSTIISIITDERPLPLAVWAAEVMRLALCRPLLDADIRIALAVQALPALARLAASSQVGLLKAALQCFASSYPLLFKHACGGADQQLWTNVVLLKTAAVQLWRTGPAGAKLAAVKVIQRIIQTQTKGTADPRLQRTAEPNLSLVRPHHPFLQPAQLEDDANRLLEECITTLYTSRTPDVVSALAAIGANLVKLRPAFANLVITALTNWTPAALAGMSNVHVRSVEKTIRACLTHLLKSGHGSPFATQINDFLSRQAARMERAVAEARQQRELEASRKRQALSDEITNSSKRRRLDSAPSDAQVFASSDNPLSTFDATTLPVAVVIDLIINNFQGISDATFNAAIEVVRRRLPSVESTPAHDASFSAPMLSGPSGYQPPPPPPQVFVKAEPVDPLKLDLGAEELDMKAEVVPEAESDHESEADDAQAVDFDFDLAAEHSNTPTELSTGAKTAMIQSAMRRICAAGTDGASPAVWVPLVARLITRGLQPEGEEDDDEEARTRRDSLRQIVFDFIIADLQSRMEFARLWLNEEWYTAARRKDQDRPYDRWLRRLLEHICNFSSNKDKAFSQFMIDLPEIPSEEIGRLCDMCLNPDQVQLGFSALRELAVLRPPTRAAALDVLLSLTTHADKLTRNAAIMAVKRWVPDTKPLSASVVSFALSLYARLEVAVPPEPEPEPAAAPAEGEDKDGEEDMAMEATPPPEPVKPPFALVENGKVIDRLDAPKTLGEVVQHVELLLALCVKNPDLLYPLFEGYARLQPFAQESLQSLITPLVRSLGLKHPKILEIIETFPAGSDELILRILTVLAEGARLPKNIIEILKTVAARQALPARFYVLIIADCDKPSIIRYLPRIITLLNNTPEEKSVIRSCFLSVTAPPSQLVGVNHPSRTKSDQITAVELMTLLHKSEKESGLKCTIEAIAICFSMSDAFRPEVLAAFMQQLVDEPVLPVLFMRTVIQAVTTYKTLQPFVSATLLPRLISKKVWETGPLWEGFIRCAKVISPHSFAALLLLPQEQLKDVVEKQPTLKGPLREYVKQKTGSNKARSAVLFEALGGEEDEAEASAAGDATEESRAGTPSEAGGAEASPALSSVGGQGIDFA
ncbi:Symplekin tight junction protein C terminal-domain-containing protein [Leucosporidium creatinivorum]|uniref:Symplekin tight junction protein C terminal-domain-containing protein n=1 Tax=Leucosporidium creatinivorum TaxID=106004 RepID=A0A1Y2G504_9BASI|nr:Symplekin tight junction protein C terminal-domain-containing protein [Leucosporidium creatinivorum]